MFLLWSYVQISRINTENRRQIDQTSFVDRKKHINKKNNTQELQKYDFRYQDYRSYHISGHTGYVFSMCEHGLLANNEIPECNQPSVSCARNT